MRKRIEMKSDYVDTTSENKINFMPEVSKPQDIDFKRAFEFSDVFVICWIVDSGNYEIEHISDNISLLGYRPEEFYEDQTLFLNVVHPEQRIQLVNRASFVTENLEANTFNDSMEMMRKDGQFVKIKSKTWATSYEGNNVRRYQSVFKIIPSFKDIQIGNCEKYVEQLGNIAGEIAHDFNNLLSAIWGRISVAKSLMRNDEKVSHMLAAAEKSIEHAKDISNQLLTFSDGGSPVKETVDIKEKITQRVKLTLKGKKIKPYFKAENDNFYCLVDTKQISQVVNNIVENAIQSSQDCQKILVSFDKASALEIEENNLQKGEYVKIGIRDYGEGIPHYEVENIFNPYFSTKKRGFGIGLAICKSIVEKHGGKITVFSELGSGSVFKVYLPVLDDHSEEVTMHDDHSEIIMGKGRVLVMDDDEMVREFLEDALNELGYEVTSAADGKQAIEEYQESMKADRKIDVAIMDLTVPGGMGGREAMQRLKKIDPTAKALVSSGYSNDPIMAEYEKYGFSGVMEKPYNLETLSRRLHEVLSA